MAEVVVIGGGVMGLLAARELRERGHGVVLLERDQPGRQASWASAGIIGKTVRSADDPFQMLIFESTRMYPDLARELALGRQTGAGSEGAAVDQRPDVSDDGGGAVGRRKGFGGGHICGQTNCRPQRWPRRVSAAL